MVEETSAERDGYRHQKAAVAAFLAMLSVSHSVDFALAA